LADVALSIVRQGYGPAVLQTLELQQQAQRQNARYWQALGLAARQSGELALALKAFEQANRLRTNDPLLAHSLAQARFEAGLDAVDAFQAAIKLAPSNGQLMIGLASALRTAGHPAEARAFLNQVLAANPLWIDGHRALIHLRWLDGEGDDATAAALATLRTSPQAGDLWGMLINLWIEADRYPQALSVVEQTIAALGTTRDLDIIRAICQSEAGQTAVADAQFASLTDADIPALGVRMIRHALRCQRIDQAAAILDKGLTGPARHSFWPYATLIWRILDDPRYGWLFNAETMVRRHRVPDDVMQGLRDHLVGLHPDGDEPVNQSVRGGTQTERPLFASIDPSITALRNAIRRCVQDHVAALPPKPDRPDMPDHPLLHANRTAPVLFAGSWSVRLRSGGNHSEHIHSQGWLSSALYVHLPAMDPAGDAGCFCYGTNRDLLPDMPPLGIVRPAVGTLVLFPSYMWHGTQPFADGERITAAFDVAPPLV
jgi:tetratricopeptide (TPR) repeat protein